MRSLALIALCTLAAACDSTTGPFACTQEFAIRFTPGDTTVSAGSEFNATIELSSCGGREKFLDTFAWSSADTTVISVRPVPGTTAMIIVTARGAGSTRISAIGADYGKFVGPQITVH